MIFKLQKNSLVPYNKFFFYLIFKKCKFFLLPLALGSLGKALSRSSQNKIENGRSLDDILYSKRQVTFFLLPLQYFLQNYFEICIKIYSKPKSAI